MNKPSVTINQSTLRILYFQYKAFIVPVIVIFVCVIIFITVIIPQFQQVISLQGQIADSQQRVTTLNNNIAVATGINDTIVNSQLKTTFLALPQDKDFAAILNAISNAAVLSNVSLGDYSLSVGDIASNPSSPQDANLQLSLNISGDISQVRNFITQLKNQLPLSDISQANIGSGGSGSVTITFFAKPFSKITFLASAPIQPLTKSELDLLSNLYTRNQQAANEAIPTPSPTTTASASATQ